MVGSWLRWSVLAVVFLATAAAQGTLSGTYAADEVAGAIVIACWPSEQDGCDEARSGTAEVVGSGRSGTWRIDGLGAGPFLLIAWRDLDGDGEAAEQELDVLLEPDGSPRLVAAPAQGLVLGSATAAAATPSGKATLPGAVAATALPADLVGVWQMTRASAGDYRDVATGSTFSMTSGFSTMLKLRPDGSFLYQFYSSGTASNCAFVSSLDTAVGSASWQPGRLVLTPAERTIEVSNCAASGTYDGGREALVFDAVLEESFDFNQLRTWTLRLEGGPVPLAYTLLDRPPLAQPPVRPQPADFVLGVDPPYAELVGLWTMYPNSVTDFYDPVANTFYVPGYDGTTPMWFRFVPGGYEMAHVVPNAGGFGVCQKDLLYYERGQAQMVVVEDVGGQGNHFRGHVRLTADDARVIVQVRDCGPDDGVVQYGAPLETSYFEWTWWRASNDLVFIPEMLSLHCPWPYAEYQGLFCKGSSGVVSMYRRE